ncbi:MAG: carboxylesterase family protein, partial [Planctomycetes bacterium]|nr:carboxylesterase family protein [Planctomycetota bacterium]
IDRALARTMSAYWVNFATTGDPNGPGLPKWPAYEEQSEPYMVLSDLPQARNHLLKAELDFMTKYFMQQWQEDTD